ncbi:MAG: hypothetical protein QOJ50_840 [Cryptosporangiaceae bacterium]|nr:hypothetical protein [Cryptosporangiaceae bacterium]
MHARGSGAVAFALMVLVVGMVQLGAQTAGWAECHKVIEAEPSPTGGVNYVEHTVCDAKGDGDGGSDSSGGGKPETCHLQPEIRVVKGPSWCSGDSLCYIDETKSQDDPAVYPPLTEAKPAPPDKYVFLFCYLPPNVQGPVAGRWVLNSQAHQPSQLDLARESYGSLQPGDAQIRTSPAGKTVVNLDTWFTLGAPAAITGSRAGSLVAVATLDTTTWQFGDGSERSCPAADVGLGSKSCVYTYRRSSAGHLPYTVTVTRTYKVHYEVNGAEQAIEGAPDNFTAPPASIPLVVTEIQTTVTSGR